MCGRYGRRSDKQKIAEAFHVKASLDEIDFMPSEDITPGSMQPVVFSNADGERDIELMYWGFSFPRRFTFNTRADSIMQSGIWKNSFAERRCIVPADSFFEHYNFPALIASCTAFALECVISFSRSPIR